MIDRASCHFVPVEKARRMPELAGTALNIQCKNGARPVGELCAPAIPASLLTFRQAARALSFLLNIPSYRQQAGAF